MSITGLQPLAELDQITVDYRRDGKWFNVIRDLSLAIQPGEAVGLAGESGCGKSTLASILLGEKLSERRVSDGRVVVAGSDPFSLSPSALRALRRQRIAFVPQNGGTALTPTMRIWRLFDEVLRQSGDGLSSQARRAEARRLLAAVGMPSPDIALTRFPHQFSGGQQQRIMLALALATSPDLLILDEPTTGQDALTRQAIVDLLIGLRSGTQLSMLYVSHDLATLSEVCDRLVVMYAGEIVEVGPTEDVLLQPRHPYTRALVASVPQLARQPDPAEILSGGLDRRDLPEGCRFAPRCRYAEDACAQKRQHLAELTTGHAIACDIVARGASLEKIVSVTAPEKRARAWS